jgi:hypothetical protein
MSDEQMDVDASEETMQRKEQPEAGSAPAAASSKPRFEVKKVPLAILISSARFTERPPYLTRCTSGMRLHYGHGVQHSFLTAATALAAAAAGSTYTNLDIYVDIAVENCAICRNHIMELCTHFCPVQGSVGFVWLTGLLSDE